MKKYVLIALTAAFLPLGFGHAAESKASSQKFYGKITALNAPGKSLTVLNKSRKQEATFAWDEQTLISKDKNSVQPSILEVGQYLSVAYNEEGDSKKATKITIRNAPFKKKQAS